GVPLGERGGQRVGTVHSGPADGGDGVARLQAGLGRGRAVDHAGDRGGASCTPRKAGVPCWIVALSSPDWIRSAIETAFSIGMAKPAVAAVWPDDAAVSMPTTLPSLA